MLQCQEVALNIHVSDINCVEGSTGLERKKESKKDGNKETKKLRD